jgi:hypothetical protein
MSNSKKSRSLKLAVKSVRKEKLEENDKDYLMILILINPNLIEDDLNELKSDIL